VSAKTHAAAVAFIPLAVAWPPIQAIRRQEQRKKVTMDVEFSGAIWYWRGPAPHHFVTVPAELCRELKAIAGAVTYGWGMIPAQVRIGATTWTTSLFPKDGGYIVPIRASVQRAEGLTVGAIVTVRLVVG